MSSKRPIHEYHQLHTLCHRTLQGHFEQLLFTLGSDESVYVERRGILPKPDEISFLRKKEKPCEKCRAYLLNSIRHIQAYLTEYEVMGLAPPGHEEDEEDGDSIAELLEEADAEDVGDSDDDDDDWEEEEEEEEEDDEDISSDDMDVL